MDFGHAILCLMVLLFAYLTWNQIEVKGYWKAQFHKEHRAHTETTQKLARSNNALAKAERQLEEIDEILNPEGDSHA